HPVWISPARTLPTGGADPRLAPQWAGGVRRRGRADRRSAGQAWRGRSRHGAGTGGGGGGLRPVPGGRGPRGRRAARERAGADRGGGGVGGDGGGRRG